MDRRHRFSSPFSSTRVYSRKYPRLHSCAIFIAKTLNVSSFSKYLTQSQNFLSYVYSFHTELYVQTSIRFYLKSPRLFDRIRLFEISFESPRFEAWKSCSTMFHWVSKRKGGKRGGKSRQGSNSLHRFVISGAKILRTGNERIVSMDFFSPRFCAFFILNSPRNVT